MDDEALFRPVVGIDLGTTNSLVAVIRQGRPEVVPIDGDPLVPSVVHRAVDGTLLVGQDAKAALVAMPERTVASIKRLMGTDKLVQLAGDRYTPVEISAMILSHIKREVDALYGEGPKEAVITVPAYFNEQQRRHTQEAGRVAGFVVERIINEPTAAALAFGLSHLEAEEKIVVYDLGGGTFDISVVQLEAGILEVVASNGHRALGGDDFDQRIVDRWCDEILEQSGFDARTDIRALARLKHEAEVAKMALSEVENVGVDIPVIGMTQDGRPVTFSTELQRSQFEELIEPLLAETMTLTRRTLEDAGITPQDVSAVLLVGGSTRIPRVRALIQEEFHQTPRTDVHPDQAVALGAAVQAGLKSGALNESGLIVTDVAPFSMGIAVVRPTALGGLKPGGYAPIIAKNTTIPTTRTQEFYTVVDGQTSIDIEVYQGEAEWVKGNQRLGSVTISGLAPKPAGQESITVTFRYTLNGTLDVSARAPSTGANVQMRLNDALDRSSADALEKSRERISTNEMQLDLDDAEDIEPIAEDIEPIDEELLDRPSWDQLVDDQEQLTRRLSGRRKTSNSKAVDDLVKDLAQARQSGETDRLEAALDRAYDWLLEQEE